MPIENIFNLHFQSEEKWAIENFYIKKVLKMRKFLQHQFCSLTFQLQLTESIFFSRPFCIATFFITIVCTMLIAKVNSSNEY